MLREPTAAEWALIEPATLIPWRPGLTGLFINGRLVMGGTVEENGTGWAVFDREAAKWRTACVRAMRRCMDSPRRMTRVHVQDGLVRGADLVEYLGFTLTGVEDVFGMRWLCYERP